MRNALKSVVLLGGAAAPAWVLRGGVVAARLDIDFVNDRAYNGGLVSINSLLTCARSAPATTYYIKTDGTLASFSANAMRYGDNGLLQEEARTNLALQASDFTNASWTKLNMSTAKTATGPDGVSNSATTLTAAAANATALQAITSGSAARITSCWIKRRTGTGNIDLTQDNGTTWGTVAVTGTWTRFAIASVTSANPTVGIRIVTDTDAVDVWVFQHEVGAFVTSPIPTTTATVARSADQVSLLTSAFGYNAAAGSAYFQGQQLAANVPSRGAWAISDATLFERIDLDTNAGNAALSVSSVAGGGANINKTFAAGALYKAAGAWAANDIAYTVGGAAVGTDASAAMPTVTTLFLGAEARGNLGYFCGNIKRFAYWTSRVSNGELQSLST